MMELERRIRRLEDRAALHDLIVRYFMASDGDDLATIGASFTDEATFCSSGAISGVGRDGIVAFIAEARRSMGLTVHTLNSTLFDFQDDDRANGLVGAHLELVLGGEFLFGAVRYEDDYVRTPEGWRIDRRDMKTIYIAPWSSIDDAMKSPTPIRWQRGICMESDLPRQQP